MTAPSALASSSASTGYQTDPLSELGGLASSGRPTGRLMASPTSKRIRRVRFRCVNFDEFYVVECPRIHPGRVDQERRRAHLRDRRLQVQAPGHA